MWKKALPSTNDTKPFLPDGAIVTNNDLNTGLTIEDKNGNEWVWIEVPKSIYNNNTYNNNGVNIPGSSIDYAKIETVMHEYTKTYRDSTYTDTWCSEEQYGFKSSYDYNKLKNKMLTSVYKNGGFYIGKYEVGTEILRDVPEAPLTTPVIKEGAYPYDYVTCLQAQQKATELSTGGKTSSLMFGVQWNLVLKHIETKGGKTVADLNQDSSLWGNYNNVAFDVNKGKYSEIEDDCIFDFPSVSGTYIKKANPELDVLLTTGATERNSVLNIYDLAGNVWEWTLEYSLDNNSSCIKRGGACYSNGFDYPSSKRQQDYSFFNYYNIGFRPALY